MLDREEPEQLTFGVVQANDPSKPPATRAECPTTRPCPHTRCRHHLYAETERSGRPWDGEHNTPTLRTKEQSCTLDYVQDHPDGVGYKRIGKLLGLTRRRAQQIGDRAVVKVGVATAVLSMVEEMRAKLPPGVILDSAFPANSDTGSLLITLVFTFDK